MRPKKRGLASPDISTERVFVVCSYCCSARSYFLVGCLADNSRCASVEASLARHCVHACDTIIDLDLTVKRRDPDAPIRVAIDG
jgi:hypothetical protein